MLTDFTSVVPGRELTSAEVNRAAESLLDATVADDEKADFLRAWALRGETAQELAACAEAFLPQAVDPGVRGNWHGQPLLDCCGTGGGGLNLINISTGLMFVLSAMGIPVVKHGNRGLSKKSGSADVLEALGIRIDLAPGRVAECLEEVGCAFLFALAYHPSFAAVANVRRQLGAEGRRTIFNLLGPLLNPARPEARLVGVFRDEHVVLYEETLIRMGCARYAVAYGKDAVSGRALGEVSPCGPTFIRGTPFVALSMSQPNWTPDQTIESLLVQDANQSAARLTRLLRGDDRGLGWEMLIINAAVAAWTQGRVDSVDEGMARSREALESGRAYDCLLGWQKFSRG